MPSPITETSRARILEITVKNHPGVMSHVCGLFARRAYNVDGILCLPDPDRLTSHIWLRLQEDARLGQIIRQIEKLIDVLEVREHQAGHDVFVRLEQFFHV